MRLSSKGVPSIEWWQTSSVTKPRWSHVLISSRKTHCCFWGSSFARCWTFATNEVIPYTVKRTNKKNKILNTNKTKRKTNTKKTKQNKKQNKTKQKTKQNKTKQNKTKQNKTHNKTDTVFCYASVKI
jgi:hypothetical protein